MLLALICVGFLLLVVAYFISRLTDTDEEEIHVSSHEEANVINAFGDSVPVIVDCKDDCPCRQHTPHYHWIDLHYDVLQNHPDCFVALHPEDGILFFDTDIRDFAEKYEQARVDRSRLMILHTSMLVQVMGFGRNNL